MLKKGQKVVLARLSCMSDSTAAIKCSLILVHTKLVKFWTGRKCLIGTWVVGVVGVVWAVVIVVVVVEQIKY